MKKEPRKKLPKELAVINADNCTGCEARIEVCPVDWSARLNACRNEWSLYRSVVPST